MARSLLRRASSLCARFFSVPPLATAEPESPLLCVLNMLQQKDIHLQQKDNHLQQKDNQLQQSRCELQRQQDELWQHRLDLLQAKVTIKGLNMCVLRLGYRLKVRGIVDLFIHHAKATLVQEGISYKGNYPFQEILQCKKFSDLKECLQRSTGQLDDHLLVQNLRSLLTHLNGFHHPMIEEGETLYIPKVQYSDDIFAQMMICIGRVIDMKIVFTEEEMSLIVVLASNTTCQLDASYFIFSIRNFPCNRGPMARLYKPYMGFLATIYSNFCDNFFSMLMTVLAPMFCLITAIFLQPMYHHQKPQRTSK